MLHWAQTDWCDILQLMSERYLLCLQVVEVYSGTPHIEEYLQAYFRLARVKGEEVSRVCAFHCSKVVKAAGPHQYDPPLHLCMPETVYLTPQHACHLLVILSHKPDKVPCVFGFTRNPALGLLS